MTGGGMLRAGAHSMCVIRRLDLLVIEELFDGKYLAGGYILAERLTSRYVAGSWKMDALVSHLAEVGDPPFVWADDDAVRRAMGDYEFSCGVIGREPRLLMPLASSFGLLRRDVADVATFIDEQTR